MVMSLKQLRRVAAWLACALPVDKLHKTIADEAARRGHVDCLVYALKHDCPIDDYALDAAAWEGELACVEVLVARGLPRERLFAPDIPPREHLNPGQLRCLKHILDNGCPIHPSTLIVAAQSGDLDTVRWLHKKGVHLWDGVCEEDAGDELDSESLTGMKRFWLESKIMTIPRTPEDAEDMWKTLLYGWANGAPVTPVMGEMFRAKRAATRATLLCFHGAARLSQGEGASSNQRATWAVMGHIPTVLVEKIIMHAKFEIRDTWGCSLPRGCGVRGRIPFLPHVLWLRNGRF